MGKTEENGKEKRTYPYLPVKHWWALRRQFRRSIPQSVTANYVCAILEMDEKSARSNVIPPLKMLGIIDDEGKPTDLAVKWRDDSEYAKVCANIKKNVYPDELLSIVGEAGADRAQVERWFASHTKTGEVAVRRMAAMYLVLCEADPSKEVQGANPPRKIKKEVAASNVADRVAKRASSESAKEEDDKEGDQESIEKAGVRFSGPALHLNVQIHISPDTSPEQVDQIFASMARHLKQFSDY